MFQDVAELVMEFISGITILATLTLFGMFMYVVYQLISRGE